MFSNILLTNEIESIAFVSYGKVITNKDGIIQIVGLEDVVVKGVVSIGSNSVGMVMNIESDSIKAPALGNDTKIVQDALATSARTLFYVPVGENLPGGSVTLLLGPSANAFDYATIGENSRNSQTGALAINFSASRFDIPLPIDNGVLTTGWNRSCVKAEDIKKQSPLRGGYLKGRSLNKFKYVQSNKSLNGTTTFTRGMFRAAMKIIREVEMNGMTGIVYTAISHNSQRIPTVKQVQPAIPTQPPAAPAGIQLPAHPAFPTANVSKSGYLPSSIDDFGDNGANLLSSEYIFLWFILFLPCLFLIFKLFKLRKGGNLNFGNSLWLRRWGKTSIRLIFTSVFVYYISTTPLGPIGIFFVASLIKAMPVYILLWARITVHKYKHLPILRWVEVKLEEAETAHAISRPLMFGKMLPDKFKANLPFHKLPPSPKAVCLGSRNELILYKEPLPLVKYIRL
jgi:hypothetical protein